jgi:hypothetical protein
MSDNNQLDSFRNPDGNTSHAGQSNAGAWERTVASQPSPQQSWESNEAYTTRTNSFYNDKKD